ncbi:MAG TPA: 1-deoxy-D-xylulose-5-phosphate synthase, partial [Candidatus Angelobacter sp.]|nr:1-deoxy-D-xylulose-5-phosphate synthase [Candidatus Angelobacter sp.]
LARYLTRITSAPVYRKLEVDVWELLGKVPAGGKARTLIRRIKESMKNLVVPNILFEEFGFKYYGPIDGHDLPTVLDVLKQLKEVKGPVLLHTLTRKGKGYRFAEEDARKYHGVSSFDKLTGTSAKKPAAPAYTEVYGQSMIELAAQDPSIVAITAAMPDGTGLATFAGKYPERFHDVGIAEQHGTCFAAGIAAAGAKPFVTIYSTFLQRAYDQIVHDVAVQGLPVRFALDRAGLVGEDGATHHGVFDIAYLRCLPGFTLMAPKDENEFRAMLTTMAAHSGGPIAVRYPRGSGLGVPLDPEPRPIPIGEGELLEPGSDLVLVAYGTMVAPARAAAKLLQSSGISAAVINARFAKPLDERLILEWARRTGRVATLEEAALPGGFGDAVLEALSGQPDAPVKCIRFGIPDRFFDHGTRDSLLRQAGLDAASIAREVERWLKEEPRSASSPLAPVGSNA